MATVTAAVTSPERLAALRRLLLLDSPPQTTFDRLTRLASDLLETPIALLTLVDANRQFFLSSTGLPEPFHSARQSGLDYSICQYAITRRRPLIVSDARLDVALSTNRAVTDLGVIAYAGIPLITVDGHAVGTLCVADIVPRDWTDDRLAILARLADITMDEIRLHFLERATARRRERHRRLSPDRPAGQ